MSGGVSAICVLLQQDGIVDTEPTVTFGTCSAGVHLVVNQGGSLNINGHGISGTGYNSHVFASGASNVSFSNTPISLAAANFTNFILAWGAAVNAGGVTFTGAGAGTLSVGNKYLFQYGASLLANGRNPNSVFPGNVTGTVQLGTSDGVVSSIPSFNYSALTVTPVTGMVSVVIDSTVNAWGATITAGGGGNQVLAWYGNGRWAVIGA